MSHVYYILNYRLKISTYDAKKISTIKCIFKSHLLQLSSIFQRQKLKNAVAEIRSFPYFEINTHEHQ